MGPRGSLGSVLLQVPEEQIGLHLTSAPVWGIGMQVRTPQQVLKKWVSR